MCTYKHQGLDGIYETDGYGPALRGTDARVLKTYHMAAH